MIKACMAASHLHMIAAMHMIAAVLLSARQIHMHLLLGFVYK